MELNRSQLSVNDLYSVQSRIWNEKNEELFGLSINQTDNPFMIELTLNGNLEDFWLNGTCLLKEKLLDGKTIKDKEQMLKDSWELEYNSISGLVGLSAKFIFNNTSGKRVNKSTLAKVVEQLNDLTLEEREELTASGEVEIDDITYIVDKVRVAYLPLVLPLGYRLKNSECSLRTKVVRNDFLIRKVGGVVQQKKWSYKDGEFSDGVNHFSDVHENNYPFLNAILGEQVTEENFTRALDLMPEYDSVSVLYYNFKWFDEVKYKVLTARKSVNPKQGGSINYVSVINSKNKYSKKQDKDLQSNLVIVHSKIKSLEVSRSVIYAPPATYLGPFNFHDAENLFDAFKVPTNNTAGRNRILLDNVYVEDNMLKVDFNGQTFNQYDIILGNVPDEYKEEFTTNLSSLSRSPYNYLNDAKRIMFCAKLRGQAVRVKGQVDDLTHEVPARVVFADWRGFSFGDSFVISESFAKKLERNVTKKFELKKADIKNYEVGQSLTIEDLVAIDQKNRFSSWRDIHVSAIGDGNIEVTARAPFGVGDKITNMHGSKGIVSVILPDHLMPCLVNDLSENMPAGPVDIIVPGISVFRRKSTGQMFEASTRALGIGELTLEKLNRLHHNELAEFDANSQFIFVDKKFSAPCGINHFIRLDHDATTKQSFAYIKSNYNYNLHVAEMELLNLAARGYYNILNELDIRALNKHSNSIKRIRLMQKNGVLEDEVTNSPFLHDYMRYLGWDIHISNNLTNEEIDERWIELLEMFNTDEDLEIVDNEEINIFSEEYELKEKREEELLEKMKNGDYTLKEVAEQYLNSFNEETPHEKQELDLNSNQQVSLRE